MTKIDRAAAKIRLAKQLDKWIKMSDADLFIAAHSSWPNIVSATRDECIKFLVINFVEYAL